jgi:hypothetical protein
MAAMSPHPEPFVPLPDLDAPLGRVAGEGAAFVKEALAPPFLRRIRAELAGVPVERAPDRIGEVRQETEAATLPPDLEGYPATSALRVALVGAVRSSGIRGLATWWPDDVAIQRYRQGALGITSHRDGKRFRRLVAVFTLEGRARFAIRSERHGRITAEWEAGPGALILLRAPGLAGARDGRPFHEVSGPPMGIRSSVAFRMAGTTGPGASDGAHRRPSG